jgi:hypothetical protein
MVEHMDLFHTSIHQEGLQNKHRTKACKMNATVFVVAEIYY